MDEKSRREILKNGNTCMPPTFGNTSWQKTVFSELFLSLLLVIMPMINMAAIALAWVKRTGATSPRSFVAAIINITNKTLVIGPFYTGVLSILFITLGCIPSLIVLFLERCQYRIWMDIISDNKLRDTLVRRNHWWNTKAGDVFYKELYPTNAAPMKARNTLVRRNHWWNTKIADFFYKTLRFSYSEQMTALNIRVCMAIAHANEMSDEEHRNSRIIHVWHGNFRSLYKPPTSSGSISDTLCTECVRAFGEWRRPLSMQFLDKGIIPLERKDVQTLVLTKDPVEIWCLIRNIDDCGQHMEKGHIIHIRGTRVQKLDDSLLLKPSFDVSDRTKFPVVELMVHPVKMDAKKEMVEPITEEEITNSLKIAEISC